MYEEPEVSICMRSGIVAIMAMALGAVLLAGCSGDDWSIEAAEASDLIRQHRNHVVTAEQAMADGNEEQYQTRMILARAALDDASRILEGMPVHRVRNVETLSVYAEAQALAGQADLVVEGLARLRELEPDNPEHILRIALVLAEMGPSHSGQALEAIHRATRLEDIADNRRARLFDAYGRTAHEAGLYDLAAEAYNEALSLDEELVWPRLGAALLLLEEGNATAAAAAIDGFGGIPPEMGSRFTRLLRDALQRFDTGGHRLADRPEQHFAYARLLVRDARYGDALLVLRRVTKQDPDNVIAWNMLGSVSANLGDASLAREAFERSLEVDPDQPRTRQSLESLGPA